MIRVRPDYINPANHAKQQMTRLCFAARFHTCQCPVRGRHLVQIMPSSMIEDRHSFSPRCFDDRSRSLELGSKVMKPVYEKIVGLTDDVCGRHLNSEYRDFARAMTAALCRKRPSPLASGQPRTWACGVLYVLGRINFLGDPSFSPHITTAELCAAFEVGESTVHAKAREIEKTLGTQPLDPRWTLPSLAEKNPLVWMAEVNGLVVDLRDMPREVQEIAFEDGLIPYIPADRKD
jgi:Domain of unknown function (DUF6398)